MRSARICHRTLWPTLAALLLLSGCATKDVLSKDNIGYVDDVEKRVASIDWDTAETVNVTLTEWRYDPRELRFTHGKPYRLHLTNTGIEPHDFSSPEFFKAVAVAKLVGPKGTLDAPRLITIGVDDGDAKDLYFVPVYTGTYYFQCEEPLHARFGMRGKVVVE
jgi:uncharacterized cupredoxin-like copper-binding protein